MTDPTSSDRNPNSDRSPTSDQNPTSDHRPTSPEAETLELGSDPGGSSFEPGGALHGQLFASLQEDRAQSAQTLEPGEDLGRFVVEEPLGRGGMGEVFAARDKELGRRVALKALRSKTGARWTQQLRQRFRREAMILSRLDHPSICRIFDLYEHQGTSFLVLELVSGTRLDHAAASLGHKDKLRLAIEMVEGIAHAHQQGVLHRDLKPANIMVTGEGHAKILDFGISRGFSADAEPQNAPSTAASDPPPLDRVHAADPDATTEPMLLTLTHAAATLGTPAYMSPEQTRGEVLGPPTDLYSFGLVLCRLFTNEAGHTATAENLQGSRALKQLVTDLLSDSPVDRPTAQQTLQRLEGIQSAGRRRLLQVASVLLVALALAAGVKYTTDIRSEREQALRSLEEAETVTDFLISVFAVADPTESIGEEVSARELLDRGSERIATELAEQPLARARLESAIGRIYLNLGLDKKAELHHRAALDILQSQPDPNLPRVGLEHGRLGAVAITDGRYPDAIDLFDKALPLIDPDEFPEAYFTIVETKAIALRRQGHLSEAEKQIDIALAATEKYTEVVGYRGSFLSAKGLTVLDQGRGEEAVSWLQEALELTRDEEGPNHPDTAIAHNNLGLALRSVDQLDEALDHFETAVEITRVAMGEDHPSYALALDNLGIIKATTGNLTEAETLMRRSVAIFEAAHGEVHPSVDIASTNLSFVLRMQGKYDASRKLALRALDLVNRRNGPGSVESIYPLRGLATLAVELGDDAGALGYLNTAIDILQSNPGGSPVDIARLGAMMIGCLERQQQMDLARQRCESLTQLLHSQSPTEALVAQLAGACEPLIGAPAANAAN